MNYISKIHGVKNKIHALQFEWVGKYKNESKIES